MKKGYRVLFIGLPMFAQRVANDLTHFDPLNTYRNYDTYFSKRDKLRFISDLRKADLVYSINGSALPSGVFSRVIKKGIPLVMHWVGTDVTSAIAAKNDGSFEKEQIEYAHHVVEAPWLKKELTLVGIDAQILSQALQKIIEQPEPFSSKFEILTYFGKGKEVFYGWERVKALAEAMPDIRFNIVGSELKGMETPTNVEVHGWVENMQKLLNRCQLTLRLTDHDGFANTVLETLANGRYVLFTYQTPGVKKSEGFESDLKWIQDLAEKHSRSELNLNEEGRGFIRENFGSKLVLTKMREYISSIIRTSDIVH